MPESDDDAAVTVTLAEIARIAGVGRAAVSNWRRRHDTFPAPVGGTDTSPQFSLPSVEQWLHDQGKVTVPAGSPERLWPKFEALGERDAMGRVIAALGGEFGTSPSTPVTGDDLGAAERPLFAEVRKLADRRTADEVFDFLLERWLATHIRQIAATPAALADLMADIADALLPDSARTVLDPACGTGSLLIGAARRWNEGDGPVLLGQDDDPVLVAVTAARIAMLRSQVAEHADIAAGDSLRADAHADAAVDAVLCAPPTNEHDWGQGELAADRRWSFGLPPRTESELAWVQHTISHLASDGVAVLLLPPAVASRRAGRRIRGELVRSGALRAVIALPVGAAPPYGITPHLWVLGRPAPRPRDAGVLLVDTSDCRGTSPGSRPEIDWGAVGERILKALATGRAKGARSVSAIELLDEHVDLSPGRHLPAATATASDLRKDWAVFNGLLDRVADFGRTLAELRPSGSSAPAAPNVTLAELERSGGLRVLPGKPVPEEVTRRGDRPADAVPVLTLPDVTAGTGPQGWVEAGDLAALERSDEVTVARPGDVVLVGATRVFDAWVPDAPVVLGPRLSVVRPADDRFDAWYLAGCLRTPDNVRRAGGHASTSSRIDVRRLEVMRLPLPEQRRYGAVFRELAAFDRDLVELGRAGSALSDALGELVAAGRVPPPP